jgi:PTS system mannose-specific IIA component
MQRAASRGGTRHVEGFSPIVTTLILTQGRLAEELAAAARRIVGEIPNLAALGLDWDDSLEASRSRLERLVASLPADGALLILTDIYGGTPSNLALALRRPGRVEVVSGVNLPMVVRLGCRGVEADDMPLEELARWIRGKARDSICYGNGRRGGRNGGA